MDISTQKILQAMIRRESRSLLQYVSEAFPWTTAAAKGTMSQIQAMVGEEMEVVGQLIRLLLKKRVSPPQLGPFPMTFTNINYTSLTHLLPLLVNYQEQGIADLENDLKKITDADAVTLVRQILENQRKHLQTLLEMTAPRPQGTAA